jgi:biotin carboxylase
MTPTVLFLGASPQQLAPIAYARSAGYRVVTCDNRPENPGHAMADAAHHVSTVDRAGILAIAEAESVAGVVCYASDVSAPTAAFVAERLHLPGNPIDSVELLTSKSRFRQWQHRNGFFAPDFLALEASDLEDADAITGKLLTRFALPLVVKPTDASGAKGVSIVRRREDLLAALTSALTESRQGIFVVEAFVERRGFQICGEGFLLDGRIAFVAFADEHFVDGIQVPVGETFPTTHDPESVTKATAVLQDIFSRLGMRLGAFNFDLFFTTDDEIFVVEIGPRNGGNRMPDAVKIGYGADLIAATVEAALGRPVALDHHAPRFCATYSVHAKRDGRLQRIDYAASLEPLIIDRQHYARPGDPAHRFRMGNQMLGNLLLGFDSRQQMLETMAQMDGLVRVVLQAEET